MSEKDKKELDTGWIVAIAMILLLIYSVLLYFYAAYMSYLRHGFATSACTDAKNCAIGVTYLLEENNIGQRGSFTIKGEIAGDEIVFYSGELFSEDKIFRNEYCDTNSTAKYWAMTMKDGRVQEVWYSRHPLTDEELHEYTLGEIQALMPIYMPFLSPVTSLKNGDFNKSNLIGYRHLSSE